MDIKSYLLGKKAGGGGSTINNQDKTITQDGTYTADSGYTGIGTATVQTNAAEYKGTATSWGNGYPTMAYYLAGNWGEPTPHTYTYEELLTLAPQANQTITEGITDVQTAKYKLYQIIGTIAQRGVNPNPVPQLQGDKIQKFVDAIISQVNPSTALENKSVTITENGTTTITPTTGKYGMNSVSVTTNVGGGADDYFVANVPSYHNNISSVLKEVPELDLTNVTQFGFNGCRKLNKIVGLKNTNNLTNMTNMFFECMSLTEVPFFDTSNVTNMSYAFRDTTDIIEIPLLNTSKVTNMSYMFNCGYTEGQHGGGGLTTVPILNTSKVANMEYMFGGRQHLTDTSLDNILQMCINATSYTRTKTLYALGFGNMRTTYPVSRIEALPHYQDFLDAGWTIGY